LGRILIVGAAGQLGKELRRNFYDAGDVICRDRTTMDLANADQVRDVLQNTAPDIILNAAAYTAVDRAESEPELALAINAQGPRVLAEEASRRNALLIHYSTDYVFDGSKQEPWVETDRPNPLNAYGASKLAGEEAIVDVGGRYLIFRTSWIYGPHGKNFMLTMLRLGRERDRLFVVDDQFGAPTTAMELAKATRTIVERAAGGKFGLPENWAGIYHMTCEGSTSWFGFAQAIFIRAGHLLNGRHPEVCPIAAADYPTPARRPRNSTLSNSKLETLLGVRLASWEKSLDEALGSMPSEPASPLTTPTSTH
jgi:dTDP-4-dehydrorhamnose reductase